MPKRPTQVILTEKEREELVQITRRHRSEQQQVLRAHIVLAAAQGHSNAQSAHELAKSAGYSSFVAGSLGRTAGDRLGDAQGRRTLARCAPTKSSSQDHGFATLSIAAVACEARSKAGRPISQWMGREIADELKEIQLYSDVKSASPLQIIPPGLILPAKMILIDK